MAVPGAFGKGPKVAPSLESPARGGKKRREICWYLVKAHTLDGFSKAGERKTG